MAQAKEPVVVLVPQKSLSTTKVAAAPGNGASVAIAKTATIETDGATLTGRTILNKLDLKLAHTQINNNSRAASVDCHPNASSLQIHTKAIEVRPTKAANRWRDDGAGPQAGRQQG